METGGNNGSSNKINILQVGSSKANPDRFQPGDSSSLTTKNFRLHSTRPLQSLAAAGTSEFVASSLVTGQTWVASEQPVLCGPVKVSASFLPEFGDWTGRDSHLRGLGGGRGRGGSILSLGHTSSDRSNEFGVHCPLQCVLSTAHDRWSTSVCVREGDTGAQKEQQLSEI